jgi:hypothetical protein
LQDPRDRGELRLRPDKGAGSEINGLVCGFMTRPT